MSWDVNAGEPVTVTAIYYLVLPHENIVLHSPDCTNHYASTWTGDLDGFIYAQPTGTPMIPIDPHHAMLLSWVDMDRMARNRPYIDDSVQAAIALVS